MCLAIASFGLPIDHVSHERIRKSQFVGELSYGLPTPPKVFPDFVSGSCHGAVFMRALCYVVQGTLHMTQRKSSEDSFAARLLGQRLRSLRKGASQADFAEKLGLTRSALANYELGRSLPKPDVLQRIAERLDISLQDLTGPAQLADLKHSANLMLGVSDSPTQDEWAILRMLRLSGPECVLDVVRTIIRSLEADKSRLQAWKADTVLVDLARLYTIENRGGGYDGLTADDVLTLARSLAAVSSDDS